jgi:hypothetical protein
VTDRSDDRPIWERLGPPIQIVIYPDTKHDVWRHAMYHSNGGIVDGQLKVAAAASPSEATLEAERMVANVCEQYHGLFASIDWTRGDNGSYSGAIRSD